VLGTAGTFAFRPTTFDTPPDDETYIGDVLSDCVEYIASFGQLQLCKRQEMQKVL
jgi:hypothetical protein